MRSLTSAIRCAWVEEELDDRPSYLDLPLQFLSIGDHPKLRNYAGGVVLCGLFVLVWELGSLVCYKMLRGVLHRRIESVLGIGSLLWQGYLVPNIVQAGVMVCWVSGTGAALYASAAVVIIVVGVSAFRWVWVLLPSQFAAHAPPFLIRRTDDVNGTIKVEFAPDAPAEPQSWLRYFGPMFDGTKDPGRVATRVVVAEEVLMGVLLSMLVGIKPQSEDSCQYTAGSMLGLTGLHVAYLLVFRPHRTKLDAAFANLNALLMLSQGVLAVIITVEGLADGPLVTGFGYVSLGLLLLLVMQFLVAGFYSSMLKARRRVLQTQAKEVTSEEFHGSAGQDRMMMALRTSEVGGPEEPLVLPLLIAPTATVELNPLTRPHT
jgi:hypothetical protein